MSSPEHIEPGHAVEDAPDIKQIAKKFDRESDYRTHSGLFKWVVAIIALCFSCFQLYTALFGILDAQLQRAMHLSFAMALVFLLYPSRKKWSREEMHWIDAVLAVLAAAIPLYVVIFYQELVYRAALPTNMDIVFGVLGVFFVLEAARRSVGWPIVIVALVFITYAFLGPYIPGTFAHRGVSVPMLVAHLYYTTEGIFGIPLGVSSTFIFLFILFGVFLDKTGLGQFFIDISNAIAGWATGGPAKVAVLSSALMGTISGSSVANVVGTGSLTIPMMKKLGYRAEFAGAVEATASTGGQLMPPIMGAAAFLMADFIGMPYGQIIKAAAIPALLYFTGVMLGVHLEAKKNGLKGLSRKELPKIFVVFKERGHLSIPLLAVIYLLISGVTPMRAALWAIGLTVVCAMLRKDTRLSFFAIISALIEGARAALGVIVACATAGVIIGVVTKTGLGLKLGSSLVALANEILLFTLIFTMITSILLGMGVPTTANYVITSTIAAPALLQLGVPVLAAHMFVFYFGIVADITPPVALAAFAGAGIARGDPLKTGVNAVKLAIAAFIIPYIFVFSPSLLLIDTTWWEVIRILATSLIGMTALASSVSGYLLVSTRFYDRIMFLVGGLLMIDPNPVTDMIGLAIVGGALAIQILRHRKTDDASGATGSAESAPQAVN